MYFSEVNQINSHHPIKSLHLVLNVISLDPGFFLKKNLELLSKMLGSWPVCMADFKRWCGLFTTVFLCFPFAFLFIYIKPEDCVFFYTVIAFVCVVFREIIFFVFSLMFCVFFTVLLLLFVRFVCHFRFNFVNDLC